MTLDIGSMNALEQARENIRAEILAAEQARLAIEMATQFCLNPKNERDP